MKKIYIFLSLTLSILVGLNQSAYTQPPPPGGDPDLCVDAAPISCGTSVLGSTTAATATDNPGTCDTDLSGPGFWYTFTGDGSSVTLTTCSPNTDFDTKLGIFEGPCGALTCIVGNDDDPNCGNSTLQSTPAPFTTVNGTVYLVYVSGFSGATGNFELTMTCAAPCAISSVTAGIQTACDVNANTYTQEITVTYSDAPTTGTLDINGQSFAITTSPQTEILTGLISNGATVDVTASFSADAGCMMTANALFTAAADCSPALCSDPNAQTIFSENFDACVMPANWQNNILTGDSAWIFVLNSPDPGNPGNLDGTCMALFDDDYLGNGAPASNVELISPIIDLSSTSNANLSFDFNYRDFTGESFYVDGWDGTNWVNLMTIAGDSIGSWLLGPPYPTAIINLAAFTNSDFQIKFGYNDNGNWGWYVGLDNIEVCGTPLSNCSIDGIVAGTQGPCDPNTNSYTQDVTVTYTSAPGTGTLDVNGQSFAITSSPQTVTLTGLTSDGLSVDVTASFSDDTGCNLTSASLFSAPASCEGPVNNACGGALTISCGTSVLGSTIDANNADNPGLCDTDLGGVGVWYTFIGDGSSVTLETCGANTDFDTKVGVFEGPCGSLTCLSGNDDACGVQSSVGPFTTTIGTEYLVYVTGFGSAVGNFELTMTCTPPCTISLLTAGVQTPCDENTNTYTQEITVTYSDAPTTGTLDINGQSFAITTSPQTEILTGLISDGLPVNVAAVFSDDVACTFGLTELFTAPTNCLTNCTASFTGLSGPYCVNDPLVQLIPEPFGGTFSGPGITADGSASSFDLAGVPLAVPDNLTPGLDADIIVSGVPLSAQLSSVCFEMEHSWVGDITVVLTNPSGTSVTLMNRPGVPVSGFGCGSDNINVTIVPGTGNDMEDSCAVGELYAITGDFTAHNGDDIASFIGDPNGTWTVNVIDSAGGDLGSLVNFTVNFGLGGRFTPSVAGPGTHGIVYTVTNCFGCVASSTITVQINGPSPDFTSSISGLDVGFSYTGDAVTGWAWDFGDGSGTSTLENPTYAYSTGGTYTVTLTVTDASGCTATITHDVTVNSGGCTIATPIITPTGPIDICAGQSVVLTATNLPLITTPPVTGELTTTFITDNGFDGNMFDVIPTVDITVNDFDIHTSQIGLTDVVEVYYKVGTHVGSETTAGDWTLLASPAITSAGDGLPTNLGVNLGLQLLAGQTYAFYLTTSQGTVDFNYTNGTAIGNVFASNLDLDILEGTGKEYPFAGSFVTRNWNGTLYYTTGGAPTTFNLSWSPTGDTTISIIATGGTYTVTVDSAGCTATSTPVVVNVLPGPNTEFSFVENGLSVDFTDLTTGTVTAWAWDFGDGAGTSVLQNPTYTYATANTFTVSLTVTDNNGCTATVTHDVTTTLGVVPPNDTCAGAITIACNSTVFGATIAATNNDNPGTCNTDLSSAPGVWYTFIGDGSVVTINTCGTGTDYDTKLGIFEGPCSGLVCLEGNDDACGLQSTVGPLATTNGTEYLVYVTGFGTGNGNFELEMVCVSGSCSISSLAAGTQTTCEPTDNTYTQEIIVTYTDQPGTGTLDVNGQSFVITASPQTIVLVGLDSDGAAVDVTAVFSDNTVCTFTETALFTAPTTCIVGPVNDTCGGAITIACEQIISASTDFATNADNPGTCVTDLSTAPGLWYTFIGDGSIVTLNTCGTGTDFDTKLGVFEGPCSAPVCLEGNDDDCGLQSTVGPLVTTIGTEYLVYVTGFGTATGNFDLEMTCISSSCNINAVTAGTQTACDPVTNTYTQEIIVEYTDAPGTGTLDVNGQNFAITASPQTVVLVGLNSGGGLVDVSVSFSDNQFCTADFIGVWTAPADCFDPCPGQTNLLWESFNGCDMPTGWTNNAITGDSLWVFGDNGGVDNIDGSCMAYFDDDALGNGALASWAELITPTIDASSGANMTLEFDFNYNNISAADSFYVDVWNGSQWDNVLLLTNDSIGFWNGGPYPHAVVPLAGYSNADFQVRFVYNDGDQWAWYVGIDNVSICEAPATNCNIDGIAAGTQGACNPVTNQYTQDVIVTYSSDPGLGTLDVNGVSVAITGSPQTVTLTGLNSNGLPVDVTAAFSDDIFCTTSVTALFTAPVTCLPIPINDTCANAIIMDCGVAIIDSTTYASTFDNPGNCGTDLSTAPGMWYTFIGTGDQVTINTCGTGTNYDTKLGLFEGPCGSLTCIDGNDDNCGLQSSINNFITTAGTEYLVYVTGFGGATGVFELIMDCSTACGITDVTVGTTSACEPATNTYTQEVTITFENDPGTGMIDVNGQLFAITASPQTVTLVGLLPNGATMDLAVEFTDNTNCNFAITEAWTAPENCTSSACSDPNAITVFSEDFNDCTMPTGWSNNIITGDSAWIFVLNSPDAGNAGNIDGTCMALFDDDYLGSGAPASNVELVTPTIDLSLVSNANLSFDFNYNDFQGEEFYVDGWDGSAWVNLMTITGDSIGPWALGPPYPTATFSLAGFANSDFQIRFGYNDNGNWGWYVGIDNIEVCGTPGCSVPINLVGDIYCVGEDSTMVTMEENYATYDWQPNGESTSFIWATVGNYTVTVTDGQGCAASLNFDVVQQDNPTEPVITASGAIEFCEGESVTLSGPSGFPTYLWNTGSNTQNITVFESGIYVLQVSDNVGCTSGESSIEIDVTPLPIASFSYTLTDFTIDILNLSQNNNGSTWTFGDGGADTVEDPSHTYGLPGVYTITLIASNDCGSDTANLTLGVMNVGIDDASGITAFSMYPNPAYNKLVMDLTVAQGQDLNISFFDQLGQIVLTRNENLRNGSNIIDFNLGELAAGVYSVKLSNDNFTQVVRLVKR